MARTIGPIEEMATTAAAFVEGECDLWQRLAGDTALLRHGLREAVAQAQTGHRRAWDFVERCWHALADPRCADEIEAFYQVDPDFERADIDCQRLYRNARGLTATARVAMAAWYCATDDDQPLLLACAQEAATVLSGQSAEGLVGLGVADHNPVVTVKQTFELLAESGWLVSAARLWVLTWLDAPCELPAVDVPVAGYHPLEQGFLGSLRLVALEGAGELVESPDRALHPLGPELVRTVRETWVRAGASRSVYWCLTVRSGGLPPWVPLDGPSLAGPMAVGLRFLGSRHRYDGTALVVGQPAGDGHGLNPVGFEREKLDAMVAWNRQQSAQNSEAVVCRAAIPRGTALAREVIETFRSDGIVICRVGDLDEAVKFAKPPRRRRPVAIVAVILLLLAPGVVWVRQGSQRCSSETTVTVAAMWSGEEQARFNDVLTQFCRDTGIRVGYSDVTDSEMPDYLELHAQDPPDVAMVPQPGLIRELVAKGHLKELSGEAAQRVKDNYPRLAQDVMSVDSRIYGVWFKATNKSIWWFNPEVLRSLQIEPQSAWTWEQLLVAARRANQRGVPWLALGGADGWPLTDLFENIYYRTAGPACYDSLGKHDIRWDHDTVVEALTMMRQLFNEGGVAGEASQMGFRTSVAQVFGRQGNAATIAGPDFILSVIQSENKSAQAEEDSNYFDFPSVAESDPVVIGGGDIAVAFTDKPDTQRLLAYLATPAAAAIWAGKGAFVSPNQKLAMNKYSDARIGRAAQSLTQHLTGTGSFRFDMSDLQPPAFGANSNQGMQYQLQRLLRGEDSPRSIAEILERDATDAYGPEPTRRTGSTVSPLGCRIR
ncbi:MAG TPA: ABC transporter substrate-binding protein [Acidimicrobiales bacterium]|nr:ABC transporter substrate-binding protein [Acidimicrobiales bacterium]